MTAPLRQTASTPRSRKKPPKKSVVLFDQENATAVLRSLQSLRPLTQTEIAEAVDISQSAVSEWLAGRRVVTFERIPLLADLYGVDPMLFLRPVEEVEKTIKPFLASIEAVRAAELQKALAALAAMDRKRAKAGENHQISMDFDARSGRHLRTVPAR